MEQEPALKDRRWADINIHNRIFEWRELHKINLDWQYENVWWLVPWMYGTGCQSLLWWEVGCRVGWSKLTFEDIFQSTGSSVSQGQMLWDANIYGTTSRM